MTTARYYRREAEIRRRDAAEFDRLAEAIDGQPHKTFLPLSEVVKVVRGCEIRGSDVGRIAGARADIEGAIVDLARRIAADAETTTFKEG